MKRVSGKIAYKLDKHMDINWKIIGEFGNEVIRELIRNPEGVHLPKPFNRIAFLLFKQKAAPNVKYDNKNIRYTNDHCGGYRIGLYNFRKHRQYTKKRKSNFIGNNLYYFRPYKKIRQAMYQIMKTDKWVDFIKFDSKPDMISFLTRNL